ncbi:dehydroquinase class II [Ilyonectria robusta]
MRDGKKTVLVINGPNLNLLGTREPQLYGYETLSDVETAGKKQAEELKANVEFFQRQVTNTHAITGNLAKMCVATGRVPLSTRFKKPEPTRLTALY